MKLKWVSGYPVVDSRVKTKLMRILSFIPTILVSNIHIGICIIQYKLTRKSL